ncbi:hypothetical protein [Kitasatospora azatica]|uniref:hypothetical protein n=1 Tax=Kitasatospora azatica TaxID=58347 RepID=UPI0006900200|nr:hypothetical protein [Kitasatospora azatica]
MSTSPESVAARLLKVDWTPSGAYTRQRISLMREFLRRSALWSEQLGSDEWPFFDIAYLVDPTVRAAPEIVAAVAGGSAQQNVTVSRSCEWALHFAALRESGKAPLQLPDPFEPLLTLFEHGGGFNLDGTGMIDIDFNASMARGSRAQWLAAGPGAYS